MEKRFLIVAIILLACGAANASEYRPKYISNHDGDTIRVEIDGRRESIRLAGVDTAEMASKCDKEHDLAIRARDFTRTWALRSGLILTTGKREREKYGRLLGNLRNSDGEDLGEKLIEAGLAVRWEGHRHRGWCE
jgi:endonuclease YncB( thermonuclease family)